MHWKLLTTIEDLVPGRYAVASATSRFPEELYADHFPSYPITPGVLLTEMIAQLAGYLVQATVWQDRGQWVFPVLGMIREAKFRRPVPPQTDLSVRAELEALRPESAMCKGMLRLGSSRCASARLILPFDPDGAAGAGDAEILAQHCRDEFVRLGVSWPPARSLRTNDGTAS